MKKCVHNFKFFTIAFALMLMVSAANAATKTASATGPWSSTVTWGGAAVPVNGDDVIINTGVIVTVDVNTNAIASLTINGTGNVTIGNSNTDRTITITGNVIISSTTGIFRSAGNGGNDVVIGGNLSNAGSFNMNDGTGAGADAEVTFNGAANQTISGTGATTDFNGLILNKTGAAGADQLEINSTNFSVPAGFLTLTNGVFKLSGSFSISNTFFNTAAYTINAGTTFWLNNTNATVTGQGGDAIVNGSLRVSAGTFNAGNSNDDDLRYGTGSSLTIDGGTVNVAAAFSGTGAPTSQTTTFNMSSGTMLISTFDNSSNSRANFDMPIAGSSFTMSGGTIIIQRTGSDAAVDEYDMEAGTVNITGGTLQFGNASTPAASVFEITSGSITPSVVISTTNAPTLFLNGASTINGNLTINSTATLNANGQPVSISGNWSNNGTFTSGTQTVTFNGAAAQTIGGANATAFSSITFNNTLPNTGIAITVSKGATIAGTATFTKGIVLTDNTNFLSFLAGSIRAGLGLDQTTDASYVSGPVLKTGNTAFIFPVGSVKVGTTGGYMPISISNPDNVADAFRAEYTRGNATAQGGCTLPLLNVSKCDFWNLNETNDAGSATSISVTLSWDDGSPCGSAPFITNLSGLTVAHFTGPKWDVPAGVGVTSTTGNTTSGTVTRTAVTIFSPFSIGNLLVNANPLPVLFNNVKAFEKGTGVQIEWTNLTEKDVVNYSVERSVDGTNFTTISQLSARSNVSDAQSYLSFDGAPAATNFYRIKVVEADGHIVYSKQMKVSIGKTEKGLVLYPNPVVGNDLSIGFTAAKGQYNLSVVNAAGQQVYVQKINHAGGTVSQAITLPVSVKSGVYNMMISGDNYKETKMFVIQ